ncbi:L,D-transpeptidase family protein [Sulfurovum sp. CS9]|uniref:L,D-transpeptidase family protein n=1 Tax=Sulfurovum sp. CS9 TaxID=3391146 RepID=UPI0039E72FEF
MIKLKNRVLRLLIGLGLFSVILFGESALARTGSLAFQENASDMMLNSLQGQPKHSFLRKLYTRVLFMPVWMHESSFSPSAKELFIQIQNDGTLNKNGQLYKDSFLLEEEAQNVYTNDGTLAEKINLEFKISQLYKAYTDYTYFGSINWGAFQARISNLIVNGVSTEWVLHRPDADPIGMVENAALGQSLTKQLQAAMPRAYHYKVLQKKLKKYMTIRDNGGWETVFLARKLKPGKHMKGVDALRERLLVTGDYIPCEESQEDLVYDACLQKAVKHFQARNGLKTDGVVGPGTLRVINISVDERITTIRLNLDRLKWLNERQEKRHVIINIPDFQLYFEEDGALIQTMRVITGTPKHPTPIFSDMVEHIVLNPHWNVPKSIIQKEMIPKLLRNPNAMSKQRIEVYTGWGRDAEKVNPASIDWSQYRYSKHMPYRFAQTPGTHNALGKVKFLFPNKFSVYMHDTPTKHLFKKDKRAFSHGCIRLQKPRELLQTFTTFNSHINFEKAQNTLKGKKKKYFNLTEKVPVDVIYLTAWVDYDGKLQFRNDVYGYDEMQLKSFRKW